MKITLQYKNYVHDFFAKSKGNMAIIDLTKLSDWLFEEVALNFDSDDLTFCRITDDSRVITIPKDKIHIGHQPMFSPNDKNNHVLSYVLDFSNVSIEI